MKQRQYIIFLFIICAAVYMGCKKSYNPPAIEADHKFLVVDGVLLNSIDSPSVFTLSRTVKLTDTTTTSIAETGATVSIEGSGGETFPFTENPGGIYKSNPLLLNTGNKYRLKITTASGGEYASDFVEEKQTPPIDSITWKQQNDVTIYTNTHDPLNNTTYYRWDFIETWQYRSKLNSELGQKNGLIYYTDSTNQTYNCWTIANSANISIASSVALSKDIISMAPINFIPQNSKKIGIRYSILVKQYAITDKAYQYFGILKKNTENLGSIFDAQPTQLSGNIHSLKNPTEMVIGYFTASSVQQQRIFIDKSQLINWNPVPEGRTCDSILIDQNPTNFLLYNFPDPEFGPFYFSGMTGLMLTRVSCLDCTLQGGTPHKPSYW